jgi:hypothetical protein
LRLTLDRTKIIQPTGSQAANRGFELGVTTVLVSAANRIKILAIVSALITTFALLPRSYGVDLYSQNFESVTLGPIVSYGVMVRSREAWTATPPAGMVVDNSGMPPAVMSDPNNGVTEFEGWTFVDKAWWNATAGDQGRSGYFSGLGKIAVADNDTHDDLGDPDAVGPYDSKLSTPSIPLLGAAANTVNLRFSSSWVPEEIQKATITARYNTGASVEVLRWHSLGSDPTFHPSAVNETVTIPLQNPAGAASVTLDFRLFDATNNWWWAIDNISVYTGAAGASDAVLKAVIDRNTSNVRIVNNTAAAVSLRGYSLRSSAGAFNEANAVFLADTDPNWVQLTAPNAKNDLSEGHLSSFNLASGNAINFGNNVWRKYYQDLSDLSFQYLVAGVDNPIPGIVEFTGNGGTSFPFLDLNFNGAVEPGDWDTFRAGFPVNLAGLSLVERYQLGDLDNDSLHTPKDFLRFKSEYEAAVGPGAFAALLAGSEVPEPGTGILFISAAAVFTGAWSRRLHGCLKRVAPMVRSALLLAISATSAQAQLTLFSENFEGIPLGPSIEEANAGSNVWSDTPPTGWTKDDSGVPGVNNPQLPLPNNNGMIEWAGWAFTNKVWWSTQVDGQGREQFARGSGTVMVADPDEWDDQPHPDVNDATGSTADCTGDTVNPCMYDAYITTKPIPIQTGIPADKIMLAFDSSWDHEGADDSPQLANNQRATVYVKYNDRDRINVLTWDSVPNPSPNFHDTAYSEAVEKNLQYNGTSTSMTLTFGLDLAENDWWWAVDNIRVFVPANPSKLRIDTGTGQVSIVGGDVIPVPINFVDITSANGVLNGANLAGLSTRKPDSVDGPDADSTVGNTSGEFWQNLSATNNRITDGFLLGSSTFVNSRSEFLGQIFNTGTPLGNRDVIFTYTTIFGDIVTGLVEYCTNCSPVGIPGDYNNNGVVDAADYVVWRKTNGTQAGYNLWRTNFGRTSGSGSSLTAVPEPSNFLLALVALLVAAMVRVRGSLVDRKVFDRVRWAGRRRYATLLVRSTMMASAAALLLSARATAAVPPPPVLDRNYDMGEGEGGVAGNTVTVTWDTAGAPGQQQLIDLSAVAGPKYEALPTTSGGPVPRRPDGGTGMAIRLNPTATSQGQHLKTGFEQALNFPERSYSSTFQPGGTIDYTFIKDRGFQLWVLPQTSGRADIVMDTTQHGALINASGSFSMRYINTDYDTGVAVLPNTWYHLMVVRPFGPGLGSIMYINGEAVARASGTYRGEDNPANEETTPLVVGANTSNVAFQVGTINRFQGLVDDLEMFVMGLNGPPAPDEFGEFIFERDNKYAAFFKPANAADLTGDNVVNMADVNVFVSNWLYQKVVGGAVLGDLTTRAKGDFNFDGAVNLSDWEILNELAPPGVGSAAWAMIHGVPEPSGMFIAMMTSAAWFAMRPARRHRASR